MSLNSQSLHLWWRVLFFLLLLLQSDALNSDGVLLLSFKYSILSDPLSVFESWNYDDATPCAWNGVTCTEIGNPGTPDLFRVTSLVLPNSQLLGSITEDLGMIQHLRHLDLSNNFLNGSLPNSIFNSSQLQVLSLSNNVISGELPELIGKMTSLQLLNLTDNAFAGLIPPNLTALQNLTVVSLKSNYFSGRVPSRFDSVEILDLSSNLLNGSLPNDFGGESLRYLNLSYNKISGTIPPSFARQIPGNTTIDLSFNNLTGPIPQSVALLNQKTELLSGNADLCGKPLKIPCSIPSTLSNPPPNVTATSSPAIAAIPKTIDTAPATNTTSGVSPSGLKPATIGGIVVGDVAGIAVLGLIILFIYQQRKRRASKAKSEKREESVEKQESEGRTTVACSCLTMKEEERSEASSWDSGGVEMTSAENGKEGILVRVDGETRLELETLLKASAYILGTSRASIVYKAVLEDGRAFAVRRIGESGIERMKEFENQVRAIAKLRHPNLVKLRAFCWGEGEKLLICDYVPNGSLARRAGSSPLNLPLALRLKIAKGVARGLAFIHDKKHVHGNIKPSNILLNSEMEPVIADFGLDRLLLNDKGSFRQLMLNQRTQQLQEPVGSSSSPATMAPSSSAAGTGTQTPYQPPESLQIIKPHTKWDVYSFGILLLELLTGRVFSDRELDPPGSVEEEKNRLLRLADAGIESEQNAILACLNLALACASTAPHKRPSMKEALQILDKIP